MTTVHTITANQIQHLRTEAAEAGDLAQVEICDRAIDTYSGLFRRGADAEAAVAECVRVIADAEAQDDGQ